MCMHVWSEVFGGGADDCMADDSGDGRLQLGNFKSTWNLIKYFI